MTTSITNANAIEVTNLVKQFKIHHQGGGSLKRAVLSLGKAGASVETFVALKKISFDIPHGQTVGVIGKNGSGKSTLLSLLARVYLPTEGAIYLNSRTGVRPKVAPLLELGAGFHPELTGYENIAFYGAVLGMNAKELDDLTPAIVEFAELDGKVDTRIHGWNDGAKLRLGFSVAIHTNPDILLVDEVLAVGDEAFQNKCYERIADLQVQGKTIVFISHDLPVVEKVATRVLWLHNGDLRMDGATAEVLQSYRASAAS